VPVNIGNPVEYELLQFAEILKKLAKKSVGNKFLPARPDDPKRRCPDITRAKTLLKWTPQVSLEEGLAKTLHYFHQESQ
jgi:nucleoside-diphosphate-sugar epimerase